MTFISYLGLHEVEAVSCSVRAFIFRLLVLPRQYVADCDSLYCETKEARSFRVGIRNAGLIWTSRRLRFSVVFEQYFVQSDGALSISGASASHASVCAALMNLTRIIRRRIRIRAVNYSESFKYIYIFFFQQSLKITFSCVFFE